MKKNILVAKICENYSDIVSGNDTYADYGSLDIALDITYNQLPDEVCREDLKGWHNPHLDMIYDEWDNL